MHVDELTHGHSRCRLGNLSLISRFERKLSDENSVKDQKHEHRQPGVNEMAITYAKIAFISIIAMVRPIQECGPAMKESREKVGL